MDFEEKILELEKRIQKLEGNNENVSFATVLHSNVPMGVNPVTYVYPFTLNQNMGVPISCIISVDSQFCPECTPPTLVSSTVEAVSNSYKCIKCQHEWTQ